MLGIQTRSEKNGIREFTSIQEALAEAERDNTVWKISFSLHTGERIRLIRLHYHGDWIYDPL